MKRTVVVWGQEIEITVVQQSASVWIAVGDYLGEPLEVKDRTENAAVKRWREAAKFKGN